MRRILDIAVASAALVVAAPVMLATALAIPTFIGGPALFRQQRTGLNGKPFTILKFRTMRETYDATGNLMPDGARMTPFGKLLRDLSIDELPNLINVLRGEMALIGPRPLIHDYQKLYTPEQGRRHEVRPGITGWAQVNGRNALSWERKFELDVWYVDNRSWALDAAIVFRTIGCVFERKNISMPGSATVRRMDEPDPSGLELG